MKTISLNAFRVRLTLAGVLTLVASTTLIITAAPAKAGCGTDDCTDPTMPYTKTCCRYSIFRCDVYKRRVCSTNPAGFEYKLVGGNAGECNGGTAPPGDPSQAACVVPNTDPGNGASSDE